MNEIKKELHSIPCQSDLRSLIPTLSLSLKSRVHSRSFWKLSLTTWFLSLALSLSSLSLSLSLLSLSQQVQSLRFRGAGDLAPFTRTRWRRASSLLVLVLKRLGSESIAVRRLDRRAGSIEQLIAHAFSVCAGLVGETTAFGCSCLAHDPVLQFVSFVCELL